VSRNKPLQKATAEFIAFIDSDDIWHPEKLAKQFAFMGDTIDFSFTAYELVSGDGPCLNRSVDTNQQGFFTYKDMLKKRPH
jgi:glycosyltransferase involved in cell wall biosynthesis